MYALILLYPQVNVNKKLSFFIVLTCFLHIIQFFALLCDNNYNMEFHKKQAFFEKNFAPVSNFPAQNFDEAKFRSISC